MDSIAIASQRDWTLTQLAPHQNSSVDLLRSSLFAGGIDNVRSIGGIGADGSSKRASDSKGNSEMSKGTRFQLYLALRVAGYHEFASSSGRSPDEFEAAARLRRLS